VPRTEVWECDVCGRTDTGELWPEGERSCWFVITGDRWERVVCSFRCLHVLVVGEKMAEVCLGCPELRANVGDVPAGYVLGWAGKGEE